MYSREYRQNKSRPRNARTRSGVEEIDCLGMHAKGNSDEDGWWMSMTNCASKKKLRVEL